jgi:hypothetical protein
MQMRNWLLASPVIGVVGLVLVGSSCTVEQRGGASKPLSQWLVYLQSDYAYVGRTYRPQGQQPTETERCASQKFDAVWGLADALIDRAADDGASLDLFANLDTTTPRLGDRVSFNRSNPRIAETEDRVGSRRDKEEDLKRLRGEIASTTKRAAREMHADALRRYPQHTQNVFQLIEAMRVAVPEALQRLDSVVVVFVSDMVHYNTSHPSQTNLERGYLNMLQDPDREALLHEQELDARWWLKGIPLDRLSLSKTSAVEVRTVLVDRCPSGESLPGTEAPDWPRIRADAKRFWSRVVENLGATVIWNYQPRQSAPTN